MSKESTFIIYCLERYRFAKSMSGRAVAELFAAKKVFDYLSGFFESLHVIGEKLIIQEIDDYILRQA
ncbi:DUF3791 domain-containing protein [Fibrobacter sp.]|uniref:DUF3791 domain-containing protein n=1 Tax=Fibrobacter sp. TaxID=35828 RepID=UPI00388FDD1A